MDTNLSIQVPVSLLQFYSKSQIEQLTAEWFVWRLWKDGNITQRKAAKLLNLTQKKFSCLLQTPRMILLRSITSKENALKAKEHMEGENE